MSPPGPTPTPPQTFLQILAQCDNHRLGTPGTDHAVPWLLFPTRAAPAVGLLRPAVVQQLRAEADAATATGAVSPWAFGDNDGNGWVSFAAHVATPAARTRVMRELCTRWRDTGLWPDEVGPRKWRAELYPVYRSPFGPRDAPAPKDGEEVYGESEDEERGDTTNYAFAMERAAAGLFGIVTYGVHMNVFEEVPRAPDAPREEGYAMWVARRAATKQTWPGFLDNSAAGGLAAGLGVEECVVKEALEEASIPADVVRAHACAVGSVSYFFRSPAGWLQPEVEYTYDLCLPPDSGTRLKPLDGEVECFELMPLPRVIELLKTGMFKYNCSVVIIDFMIRKGIITPDNEPDFQEIVTRLHGRFEHDRWAMQ